MHYEDEELLLPLLAEEVAKMPRLAASTTTNIVHAAVVAATIRDRARPAP